MHSECELEICPQMGEQLRRCYVRLTVHGPGIRPPSPVVITRWLCSLNLLGPAFTYSTCLLFVWLKSVDRETFASKLTPSSPPVPVASPRCTPVPRPQCSQKQMEDDCLPSFSVTEKQSLTPSKVRLRFSIRLPDVLSGADTLPG